MSCSERYVTTLGPTLAPPYSSRKTYAIGEWALYGDGYYRCRAAIQTPEPWNPGHWEKHANVLEEMGSGTSYSISKVAPYLASMSFSSTDFPAAKEWADSASWGSSAGGCTVFGKGVHAYRWYDWTYDEACPIVVHVAGGYDDDHPHSVAGVAAMGVKFPEIGQIEPGIIKFIPNRLVDGINDSRLFAEMNAVSLKDGDTGWHGDKCPTVISIYECLSRFSTAAEAAAWLAESVYVPQKYVEDTGFTVHYFLKDPSETWIVEDGVARKLMGDGASFDFPAMTNFRCYKPDGTRVDPDNLFEEVAEHDDHGSGLERYQSAYLMSSGDMEIDIPRLKYSTAYTLSEGVPARPSDFVGMKSGDFEIKVSNCRSPQALEIIAETIEAVTPRERGDGTWQSVHVADYDLEEGTFRVWTQEDFEKPYSFGLHAKAAEGAGEASSWTEIKGKPSVELDSETASIEDVINAIKAIFP